jgi:hypothetical protein
MNKEAKAKKTWFQTALSLLPVIVLLVSLGMAWGMTQAHVLEVHTAVDQLKEAKKTTDTEVGYLKVFQAVNTETLNHIRADLKEIKEEIRLIREHELRDRK